MRVEKNIPKLKFELSSTSKRFLVTTKFCQVQKSSFLTFWKKVTNLPNLGREWGRGAKLGNAHKSTYFFGIASLSMFGCSARKLFSVVCRSWCSRWGAGGGVSARSSNYSYAAPPPPPLPPPPPIPPFLFKIDQISKKPIPPHASSSLRILLFLPTPPPFLI